MPYLNQNGIGIYYEVAGSGPEILLVNGLGGDTRFWAPLVACLEKSFRVLAYDMRCAGKSDKPDAPFSVEDLADEAHALLGRLCSGRACVLGFSMGGMVAIKLAARHPDCVRKLFLVATAPSLKGPFPASEKTLSMFRRTDISAELLTEVYEAVFGPEYRKKVSAREFIDFRMNDENPQPAFAYLRQMEALESFDLRAEVKKITASATVIAGEEDSVIPPDNADWLSGQIKGSTLHRIPGVGHMAPLEAAEGLADILIAEADPLHFP
ncbi:MAG TPA: alpha/beta hydrolase, partial [bacterium]|nr:alpha/beta hydrolase [bacterium]